MVNRYIVSNFFAELFEGNPLDARFAGLEESEDMLLFLKSALGTSKTVSERIKLVFIGDGGVGKTSILNSFARDTSIFSGTRMYS